LHTSRYIDAVYYRYVFSDFGYFRVLDFFSLCCWDNLTFLRSGLKYIADCLFLRLLFRLNTDHVLHITELALPLLLTIDSIFNGTVQIENSLAATALNHIASS
jgi:hypothetical protein